MGAWGVVFLGGLGRGLLGNRQINIDDNFWLPANGLKVARDSPRVWAGNC
jgi:hypothetical protein